MRATLLLYPTLPWPPFLRAPRTSHQVLPLLPDLYLGCGVGDGCRKFQLGVIDSINMYQIPVIGQLSYETLRIHKMNKIYSLSLSCSLSKKETDT